MSKATALLPDAAKALIPDNLGVLDSWEGLGNHNVTEGLSQAVVILKPDKKYFFLGTKRPFSMQS